MARNLDQANLLRANGYFGEEIITGEAVALELPSATVVSRIATAIIDYGLYILGIYITIRAYNSFNSISSLQFSSVRVVITLTIAVWWWLVPALVTYLTRGSSLGHMIMSSRVVRADGGTPTLRHTITRSMVGIVEVWMTLGVLAMIVSGASKRGQRLGDMLAGTYVVRWPRTRLPKDDLVMPAKLEVWAENAQSRELPPGLTVNITNYLGQRLKLTPIVAESQGRKLAAAAETYVSPPAPWGTPAHEFLTALILVRRRVDFARESKSVTRRVAPTASAARMPYGVPDEVTAAR